MTEFNRFICGDALAELRKLPANSIDMCLTSPPYWSLRDYGTEQIFGGDKDCEHEWIDKTIIRCTPGDRPSEKSMIAKNRPNETVNRPNIKQKICAKCQAWKGQLGLEPTPEFYIEHLTEIFNEVKRILKKEGTLWLNIGDTYWGGKGRSAHGDPERHIKRLQEGKTINKPHQEIGAPGQIKPGDGKHNFIQPKSLCMIPEHLAWSLIQNGWILRNKIIWYKPNAMPSSVRDRFSNRWEYLFLFSKNKEYYFDLDAVRQPYTEPLNRWGGPILDIPKKTKWKSDDEKAKWAMSVRIRQSRPSPAGKNPGDLFEINTQSFPDAHFAVFPEKLCEKPIKAGCPKEICKECGKARERIIKPTDDYKKHLGKAWHDHESDGEKGQRIERKVDRAEYETVGWTSCKCKAGFEPGIVIDPFAGAGTVGVVAKSNGRRFILIDIKKEYINMAKQRVTKVGHQKELFE